MPKKIVVASGFLSPLHRGHITYLSKSKELGDFLIVIVNNDKQARLKHGYSFMPCSERIEVVRALECVDMVVESIDEDRTVCKTLRMLHPHVFTNGGDQTNETIPEAATCKEMGIEMIDGLGEKVQSSRWLIKKVIESDYK
jgi:cytidyltransferase-like protein